MDNKNEQKKASVENTSGLNSNNTYNMDELQDVDIDTGFIMENE